MMENIAFAITMSCAALTIAMIVWVNYIDKNRRQ